MKENIEYKSLVIINENSIFYKIKQFFRNIFKPKLKTVNSSINDNINLIRTNDAKKDNFIESLKNIENEETKLLSLQKKYESGETDKNQLSKEQVKNLIKLYKKQIKELSRSNELRKQKILNYRNKYQVG